jgi:hypothetical protein
MKPLLIGVGIVIAIVFNPDTPELSPHYDYMMRLGLLVFLAGIALLVCSYLIKEIAKRNNDK